MGLAQIVRDVVRKRKAVQVKQELANQLYVNPLCSDYENVFAQVQPLINDMKMVRPFGVGKNGGVLPIARTPELAVLNNPNDEMGWSEFAGAMFATWLTEDELNIHVHMERGKVYGYSILAPGSKQYLGNGDYYFQVRTADGYEKLTRDEVMTLRFSRSPKNLQRGVSPATSVRAWSQTEDVLAQYERAYIENGAIPASITFIRASSYDKFIATQKELENNLRGPKNHGKTIYVWRQFNNDTGESLDQVEVKTIQGNNSTLAIKELADIINDRLNKAYGVSNFILGDDSSAKYDNAELSDYQFIKRRVYPALLGFWDQFQFELDRITGGLGYSIQFELELPDLTERQKVKAETARIEEEKKKIVEEKNRVAEETRKIREETDKIRFETIAEMVRSGATAKAAVTALGLEKKWLDVARGIEKSVLVSRTPNANRDQDKHAQHKHCECSTSTQDALPEMTDDEKRIYNALIAMAERVFASKPNIDEEGVIAEITRILSTEAILGASEGGKKIVKLLENEDVRNAVIEDLKNLELSETLRDRIVDRTEKLVESYGEETRRLMNETLANSEGKSAAEIRKSLREVMPTWRAERIARTETVYAFKSGRLDEDERIAEKYGLKMKLVWRARHDKKTCDVCSAMDGEEVSVGEAFEHIKETADGTISWEPSAWNDDGRIPAPHPNCRCYFDEIVEET